MTALARSRIPLEAQSRPENGQRLLLHDIDWKTYKTLGDALVEKRVRLTYDRGALELMVVSAAHERFRSLFGLLIFVLAEELDRVIGSFGSFTHQREDLSRALEPDLCFYLQNFHRVQGKEEIDLTRDPAPDLAIEIEISRSLLDRLDILATLKVPEIWRFDGRTIQIHVLKKDKYEVSASSLAFPEVPVYDLVPVLKWGLEQGDLAMAKALRTWLKLLQRRTKTTKGKGKRPPRANEP